MLFFKFNLYCSKINFIYSKEKENLCSTDELWVRWEQKSCPIECHDVRYWKIFITFASNVDAVWINNDHLCCFSWIFLSTVEIEFFIERKKSMKQSNKTFVILLQWKFVHRFIRIVKFPTNAIEFSSTLFVLVSRKIEIRPDECKTFFNWSQVKNYELGPKI